MKFVKPTPEQISEYLKTEKNYDDFTAMGFADKFWNYYESKGWVVGKSPMKSWKAAVRTWELNIKNGRYQQSLNGNQPKPGTSEARIDAAKRW
jgi:hypothetical protein